MNKLRLYTTLTTLIIVALNISMAQGIQLPKHPRVFVTEKDIPALRKNIQHSVFKNIYKSYVEHKNLITDGISENGKPNEKIRNKIEFLAFSYLLNNKETKNGKLAISLILSYLNSITQTKDYHDNAQTYWAVLTGAMVYDWCYNLLSNDQKESLKQLLLTTACKGEYCFQKNNPKQYLNGHYGEYAPTAYIAIGLAIYDEDSSLFKQVYAEQVNSFAPSRNPWYEAETHHQGSQYIHVRYANELLQAYLLQQVGLSPYSNKIGLSAYRDMYANLPQDIDMDGMPEGDCHNHINMGNDYLEFLPLAAKVAQDGFLQQYAQTYLDSLVEIPVRAFLFYNTNLKTKPLDSLCLTKFFPSPSGMMIARTGWDIDKKGFASNVMVALMNMREYSAKNHVHLDIGHFGIYYKGHLALDAGIYQGKDKENEWGKTNYINYYTRTIAHNSLLIYDSNEPTPYEGSNKKTTARDGGQFSFKNRAYDSIQEMFKDGKLAEVQAFAIASGNQPNFSYLKGDMTKSYNVPKNVATYPAKAETVKRSFVFLNLKNNQVPGALIVLDKVVSTQASFKKTWLLHTQNKPNISDNIITALSTSDGRNGKLVTSCLLPQTNNRQVDLVGGEGKEYWVDGKNWGSVTQEDAGQWRVEISPKQEALSNNFLHVLQAMDVQQKELPVSSIFSADSNYIAVIINDRFVAQSLQLQPQSKSIAFNLPTNFLINRPIQFLFTDLEEGSWKLIDGDNQVLRELKVKKEEGVFQAIISTKQSLIKLIKI